MTKLPPHGEIAAKELIGRYGVRTPLRRFATNIDEALDALHELRPPVVVKLVSSVLHKSDVGGVRLGIDGASALREAIEAIARSAAGHRIVVDGYLIEETAPQGVEVLVGGVIDAVFGPAIVVGLGGIFTEIFDDVAARICPIDRVDACEMIREVKASPLLFGARGRPRVDVEALADVLLALGGQGGLLVEHAARVEAIDLNPVIVAPSGAVAVDARIAWRDATPHVA